MPDQMRLPGLDDLPELFHPERIENRPGRLLGYNLFLAICPEPEDAERLARIGATLRERHGLHGQCLRTEHLHMSLQAVAAFKLDIPLALVDAVRSAAASMTFARMRIVCNAARSFHNRAKHGRNAFVLRCDAGSDIAVAGLQHALTAALRRSGLRPDLVRTPHLTLLYDQQVVPEHAIEPVVWTATHFDLILSHQGLGHHERLGQWRLV